LRNASPEILRLGAEHSMRNLDAAHLEREERDGYRAATFSAPCQGCVLRDVEGQRGLTHRRSSRQDQQVAG